MNWRLRDLLCATDRLSAVLSAAAHQIFHWPLPVSGDTKAQDTASIMHTSPRRPGRLSTAVPSCSQQPARCPAPMSPYAHTNSPRWLIGIDVDGTAVDDGVQDVALKVVDGLVDGRNVTPLPGIADSRPYGVTQEVRTNGHRRQQMEP